MNWEIVSTLAEIIAAAGVVGSVLYLARQTRANAEATRHATSLALTEATISQLQGLSESADLAGIYRRGMLDPDSLDADESLRLSAFLLTATRYWSEAYHAGRSGRLDPWAEELFGSARNDMIRSLGFRRFFEGRSHWIDKEFREVIAREMEAIGDGGGGYQPGGRLGADAFGRSIHRGTPG